MTILQALDGYYGRMAARGEAEAPGYSREKISFAILLSPEGEPIDRVDLREMSGKKLMPRLMDVPASVKRTVGIAPNLLWDKTAYVLGRTAGEGQRTGKEHAAFRDAHLELLAETADPGLLALRHFLEAWTPDRFGAAPFDAPMLDANIVFRLRGAKAYVHDSPAAQQLVASRTAADGRRAICLVTGLDAPMQRLHPAIKGVEGAQSSGAALVSFNLDAFASYGKEQGENAPTSVVAAFRYGAALNRMLDRGSSNRLPRPVGDATVVFWADARSAAQEPTAQAAEDWFAETVNPSFDDPSNDLGHAEKLRERLNDIAAGRPLRDVDPKLDPGVRFHVLGLSPNAARLSIRFWIEDRFGVVAERLAQHHADLAISPPPWRQALPSVARLLVKTTASQEKFANIPPLLAGEVLRAILAGTPYPRSLLAAAVMRLRAGDDPGSGWHAAAIRAVLARRHRHGFEKEETPVSLDREHSNPAYQLGRMFAMAEIAQRMALGKVNATIRDRYFGAASATPSSVFPLLLRTMQHHLSKLRKSGKGGWIERELGEIAGRLPPSLPRSLRLEDQGRFAIGYYHQRQARFEGKPAEQIADEEADDTPEE